MINPIGTFVTTFDSVLDTAVSLGSAAISRWVSPIAGTGAALYLLIQGIKWGHGDKAFVGKLPSQCCRMAIVLWLCGNPTALNTWVIGPLYSGLGVSMITALASPISTATGGNVAESANPIAASINGMWAQTIAVIAQVDGQSGSLTVTIASFIAEVFCGGFLLVIAVVHVISKFLLAILMIFGAAIIACDMSERLRPVIDRGLGKALSLVLMQVGAWITMQIVVVGSRSFLSQMLAAAAPATGWSFQGFFSMHGNSFGPGMKAELVILAGMVLWFFGCAFAMICVPAIAYSLGTGVTTSFLPAMLGARDAAKYIGGKAAGLKIPSIPQSPMPSFGNVSINPQPTMLGNGGASQWGGAGAAQGQLANRPALPAPTRMLPPPPLNP